MKNFWATVTAGAIGAAIVVALAGAASLYYLTKSKFLEQHLSRPVFVSSVTASGGSLAESLYSVIEKELLPSLQGSVRRNMRVKFILTEGGPQFFGLRMESSWDYELSADSVLPLAQEKQSIDVFIVRMPNKPSQPNVSLSVGSVPQRVEFYRVPTDSEVIETSAGQGVLEHWSTPEQLIDVIRGKRIKVALNVETVNGKDDFIVVTFTQPTEGFEAELSWEPVGLVASPALYVFTPGRGRKGARLPPLDGSGDRQRSWSFAPWVFPSSGFVITWSYKQAPATEDAVQP